MQPRTANPRTALEPEQVDALLHAAAVDVDYQVHLLDLDDQVVADISEDVALDGALTWTGADDLHRKVTMHISRDLAWDRDRLRLTTILSAPLLGITAAFHRGVFLITRPEQTTTDALFITADGSVRRGEAWACTGWDKLRLLRDPAGRSWATAWTETAQTTLLGAEVTRLLLAASWGGPVRIDPTLAGVELTQPYVWPAAADTSWLRILNDLLAAGGADKAWVDEDGALRIDTVPDDSARPVEWVLDADDPETIVGPTRTRSYDLATTPNRWRFVASNFARTPVLGDGIYEPEPNYSLGPASITARGRDVWNTDWQRDAASHDALVVQGDAQRARDMRALATRQVTTGLLPLMGHRDLYELIDTATSPAPVRAAATTWIERWDGADSTLTLQEVL